MAAKWLQERWAILMPEFEKRGRDQEEEIQRLCEEEIAIWRRRPSLTKLISLQPPTT